MSSPFYVAPRSAGYASGSRLDEKFLNKGREYPGRGEQWLPMWGNPSSFVEVQQLFSQGRATTRAAHAADAWTMARAVASLGVSRGVSKFLRYGYQQRNNQATHFAIPMGSFGVAHVETETSSCLGDLDHWLPSLRRMAHPGNDQEAKRIPARLILAYRRLMDALFSVINVNSQVTHHHWMNILLRLGDMEAVLRRGSDFRAQPVPRLRPGWVAASDDGTAEFRLAVAFALQSGSLGTTTTNATPNDSIRRHWLPLDRKQHGQFATTGTGETQRLNVSTEVVMHGRRGLDDAVALVHRRLIEAARRGDRHLPLTAAPWAAVGIADLNALLSGAVDLDRTLVLARPLMALDRKAWAEEHPHVESAHSLGWPEDAWLAIRLCALPWPLKTPTGFELDIGADPSIIGRLSAGDAASAVRSALGRLSGAGVRCTVRATTVSALTARLWAGALAFPIAQKTARQFLYRLDPSKKE